MGGRFVLNSINHRSVAIVLQARRFHAVEKFIIILINQMSTSLKATSRPIRTLLKRQRKILTRSKSLTKTKF